MDVWTAITQAIEDEGANEFFRKLCRKSPTTVAQLLANAQKFREEQGDPGTQQVNIIGLGEGPLAGIAASIYSRPVLGDVASLDLTTARQEVQRLQVENAELKRAANDTAPPKVKDLELPKAPKPDGPPVECPQCRRTGYPNRMIEFNQKCAYGCGQHYADSIAGRETPSMPPLDERPPCADAMCLSVGPDGGWRPVKSLSIPGIHEALQQGDGRGPFGP